MSRFDLQTDAAAKLPTTDAFDFLAPPRIVFGWGRRAEVGGLAASLGRRAFVVTGSKTLQVNGTLAAIFGMLEKHGVMPLPVAHIAREPLVADVDQATAAVCGHGIRAGDFVIAIGGGSAMDLAKAVAAMATNREGTSVADYLEGVGKGLNLLTPPLPVLAVPTTAGTGSEATKNAVISSLDPPYKKSLRHDAMIPRIVLVDPELTVPVPPHVTAQTGMDAITQLIESFISCRAKPLARALALDGLKRALPAIGEAVRDGSSRSAREAMSYAALVSGMALANSGLGLAHGVAAALGVQANVAHGLACAVMLPPTLKANRTACEQEYAELAHCLPGNVPATTAAAADHFVERIEHLVHELGIPRSLSQLGVKSSQIPALVAGSRGNSLSGNPRPIHDAELTEILETIL